MNAVPAALTAMAAMPVAEMGVGVVPVAIGIATVKSVVVKGAGLKDVALKGATEIVEAVKGVMETTDIAAVLRAVLPDDLRGVFRTVEDPMNARPGGGELPPVAVEAVQVMSVPDLLVLGPVGGGLGLVAPIAAGTERDAPMEEIVDLNQVASRPAVVMETAAPASRVDSASGQIVSRTVSVGRSASLSDVNSLTDVSPGMSVHRLGPVTEHRQDARSASIALLRHCNPRPRLRRRQQMI